MNMVEDRDIGKRKLEPLNLGEDLNVVRYFTPRKSGPGRNTPANVSCQSLTKTKPKRPCRVLELPRHLRGNLWSWTLRCLPLAL